MGLKGQKQIDLFPLSSGHLSADDWQGCYNTRWGAPQTFDELSHENLITQIQSFQK
jgi:hypothetical protein